jgi:hypothetical protein
VDVQKDDKGNFLFPIEYDDLKGLMDDQDKAPKLSKLYIALAKAQGEFPEIQKTRTNPFYNSKYADLADVRKAVQPSLSKNGLSLVQILKGKLLITKLFHQDGGVIESEIPIDLSQKPQGIGSALTYLRRYCLCSILGVASEEDDDGNAGSDAKPKRGTPPPPQKKTSTKQTRGQSTNSPKGSSDEYNYQEGPSKPVPNKAPNAYVHIDRLKDLKALANKKGYSNEQVSTVIDGMANCASAAEMTNAKFDIVYKYITEHEVGDAFGGSDENS